MYCVIDNIIRVYRFKVKFNMLVKNYGDDTIKDIKNNTSDFISESDAEGFVTRYLAKHKNLEYISTEPIDVSEYEWIDGIEIPIEYRDHANDYVNNLLTDGEEAYRSSIENSIENYLINNDYRLTAIELGLN